MPELSREELDAILRKLDDVCRQAQELQQQIKQKMSERARRDRQVPGEASDRNRGRG